MNADINKQRKSFKLFMQRKKLTAYSWAKSAGITEGTIRSYITGRSSSLTYKTLHKLAEAIGVSPKEIIDPDHNYEELLDNHLYIEREVFEKCMIKIDEIINNKKIKLSDEDRRRLYLAWYDLKTESKDKHKENNKFDEERISAMLKFIG